MDMVHLALVALSRIASFLSKLRLADRLQRDWTTLIWRGKFLVFFQVSRDPWGMFQLHDILETGLCSIRSDPESLFQVACLAVHTRLAYVQCPT
jgi:hypothetical protein